MKKGIPAPNGAFRDWEVNFLGLVILNQVAWAINAGYITALQAAQTAWAAAWAIVSTGNCTSSQRTDMRVAKAAYIELLRPFIQSYIIYNTNISDGQIDQLGLKRRDKTHTPVPVPSTTPIVNVIPIFVHKAKIFVRQQPDAAGVSRRGKPKGVKFIEFAYSIDVEPASAEACTNKVLSSRAEQVVDFDESQAGLIVYYYARYINTRGEAGEYTNRQQFMIP